MALIPRPRSNGSQHGYAHRRGTRWIQIAALFTAASVAAPAVTSAEVNKNATAPAIERTGGQSGEDAWARVPLGNVEFGGFSQNGRWSVTTERGDRVRVVSLDGGAPVTFTNPTDDYLHYARISSDGKWVVAIAKNHAVIWQAGGGLAPRIVQAHPRGEIAGFGIAASPDASRLAVPQADGATQVIDVRTGSVIASHRGPQGSIFFTSSGNRVVSSLPDPADDNQGAPGVDVWDASSGVTVAHFELGLEGVDGCSVCFGVSPDGTRIAVADAEEGRLLLYDAALGPKPKSIPARLGRMTALTFSPDGSRVITAEPGAIQVRNATTGQPIVSPQAPGETTQHAAFSEDGLRIATAGTDHVVRVWDASTGKLIRLHRAAGEGGGFRLVSFSPDGTSLMGVGDDEESYVWRAGDANRTIVASKR